MESKWIYAALVAAYIPVFAVFTFSESDIPVRLKPKILIATIVRNKAHSLPYFLHGIENLDYPKDRISLWIQADHNSDNSIEQLNLWLDHVQDEYHSVDMTYDDTVSDFPDQKGPMDWSSERFNHVMLLRQAALDTGRKLWADFVFMVDADAILVNPDTLQRLIDQDKTIVGPSLNVTASSNYANFWGDIDDNGYYRRSDDYFDMKERKVMGCLPVAMVHSAVLINLNHAASLSLAYHPPPPMYQGPLDDIIVFAFSAKYARVQMFILNDDFFGFLPMPMDEHNTVDEEAEQFVHIKTEAIVDEIQLDKIPYLEPPPLVAEKDKLGFDQIYMINLKRRSDRRIKMEKCFDELGIDFKYVEAVDGKLLNASYLQSLKVRMLPGYKDPYHGRPLTRGEIGCFLSHYEVWQDVLAKGYKSVLVFEDDIRFEPYFRRKLKYIMMEVKDIKLNWDLIYLGRKKLRVSEEAYLTNSKHLVYPHYSYWTLSYLVTRQGIQKMMSHDPTSKLIPIDEFIPILFDKHIEDDWRLQFSPRDLQGFSVDPLLVYPTRYTGEPGYITDTDHSDVLNFDSDGVLHEGEWVQPEWEKKEVLDSSKTPADSTGSLLRGDLDDLPQGKEEL